MLLSSKWIKKHRSFTGPVHVSYCCVEDVDALGYLKLHEVQKFRQLNQVACFSMS